MPFIGKQSTSNSQITNYTTTVGSGGQTNFTVVIDGGDETHVYLNGVLLKETTDYTVSSTQVSLVSAAVENDIVEIKVFRSFALADAVKATGGTFTGDVTVPNLIIGDGGNIGSASDTDAIAIASDGGLTFSGGIDNAGTISAGTIGDNVNLTNNYWASGDIAVTTAVNGNTDTYINFDGSTNPYLNWDSGGHAVNSTTVGSNAFYQGSSVDRLKFVRAGIYLITWTATGYATTGGSERILKAFIHNTSNTEIAAAVDQIANTASGTDYGSAHVTFMKQISADEELKFGVNSADDGFNLHADTSRLNIALLRPL